MWKWILLSVFAGTVIFGCNKPADAQCANGQCSVPTRVTYAPLRTVRQVATLRIRTHQVATLDCKQGQCEAPQTYTIMAAPVVRHYHHAPMRVMRQRTIYRGRLFTGRLFGCCR